jgi:hypothetical protein
VEEQAFVLTLEASGEVTPAAEQPESGAPDGEEEVTDG